MKNIKGIGLVSKFEHTWKRMSSIAKEELILFAIVLAGVIIRFIFPSSLTSMILNALLFITMILLFFDIIYNIKSETPTYKFPIWTRMLLLLIYIASSIFIFVQIQEVLPNNISHSIPVIAISLFTTIIFPLILALAYIKILKGEHIISISIAFTYLIAFAAILNTFLLTVKNTSVFAYIEILTISMLIGLLVSAPLYLDEFRFKKIEEEHKDIKKLKHRIEILEEQLREKPKK